MRMAPYNSKCSPKAECCSCVTMSARVHSCWLAANDSSHAIWTFAAPMLAIIIVSKDLQTGTDLVSSLNTTCIQ